jgi:hypothetical protein
MPTVILAVWSNDKLYGKIKKGVSMIKIINMFVVGLLTQQVVQAQGTIYLSNLGQSSTGNLAVGSDSWQAAGFFTGNNTSGYLLDSIQLEMSDASGNPSDFAVMIYAQSGNLGGPSPGSSLDTLDGSANPSTAGIYTYTDDLNITLSPSSFYYIVLTAGTAIANGAYNWSHAGTYSYNPSENWGAGTVWNSTDGSHWSGNIFLNPQFSINATAVPEPRILSLLVLGSLGLLWHRRKAKAV